MQTTESDQADRSFCSVLVGGEPIRHVYWLNRAWRFIAESL